MSSGPADAHSRTFDEELLLWLGDEPSRVRAADQDRIRDIAAEFARGFDALARVDRAVTIFGSARTKSDEPDYALVREAGANLGRAGYAIITGGGPAAARTTAQPVRRHRAEVPSLLRAQGDVRPLRVRVRHLPGGLRNAR